MIRFSDPIVTVQRLVEAKSLRISKSNRYKLAYTKKVEALATKGNEGLRYVDPHTCCICRKIFTRREQLKVHLEVVHCKSKKMFCDLCPKIFFTEKIISQHMRLVHSKKNFACNVCDFKTVDKYGLKIHMANHSAKVECPICKKHVSTMKSHMRIHKPKEKCLICQKMVNKSYMKQHVKAHSKRCYKCESCNEVFDKKRDLKM